jgi:hypothetical protein
MRVIAIIPSVLLPKLIACAAVIAGPDERLQGLLLIRPQLDRQDVVEQHLQADRLGLHNRQSGLDQLVERLHRAAVATPRAEQTFENVAIVQLASLAIAQATIDPAQADLARLNVDHLVVPRVEIREQAVVRVARHLAAAAGTLRQGVQRHPECRPALRAAGLLLEVVPDGLQLGSPMRHAGADRRRLLLLAPRVGPARDAFPPRRITELVQLEHNAGSLGGVAIVEDLGMRLQQLAQAAKRHVGDRRRPLASAAGTRAQPAAGDELVPLAVADPSEFLEVPDRELVRAVVTPDAQPLAAQVDRVEASPQGRSHLVGGHPVPVVVDEFVVGAGPCLALLVRLIAAALGRLDDRVAFDAGSSCFPSREQCVDAGRRAVERLRHLPALLVRQERLAAASCCVLLLLVLHGPAPRWCRTIVEPTIGVSSRGWRTAGTRGHLIRRLVGRTAIRRVTRRQLPEGSAAALYARCWEPAAATVPRRSPEPGPLREESRRFGYGAGRPLAVLARVHDDDHPLLVARAMELLVDRMRVCVDREHREREQLPSIRVSPLW